jgi:predicted  nucleic acid-binding Zn-ribbon protein
MTEPTEIEKKSLEAHVELCAERYRSLDERLDNLTEKISKVEEWTEEIKEKISKMAEKNNDRLINWGVGIIVSLIGMVGWLLTHFILK